MIKPHQLAHTPVLGLLTGHYHETSGYRVLRPDGVGDWLLIHTIAGAGRFGHAGGELISGPRDWVLIRPGTLHDYAVAPAAASWELLWVHFHPRAHWLEWLDWPAIAPGLMLLRPDPPKAAERFHEVHRLLHGDLRQREAFAMHALEGLLLECDLMNPLAATSHYDARVRRAMDYLDGNLASKVLLDDVAAAVGLSSSRLAHLFTAETGQSVQRYLEMRRMQRASELLARTGFSVLQIAETVGFDSQFYFSQRFKRWTRQSPLAFRQSLRPVRRDRVDTPSGRG
jgi:AraC family transcriptional regulator of arabinose operon